MVLPARGRLPLLRLALVLGAVGGAFLLGPPTSAEAVGGFHAAPDGSGSACTVEAPCDLDTAIETAPADWLVQLAPGTYEETQTLVLPRPVVIEGEAGPGGPKPLIEVSSASVTSVLESTAAVTLRDLRVHSPAGTGTGIVLASTEVWVERVESTGGAEVGCYVGGGTVRDSLCEAKPPGGGGVGVATSVQVGPAEVKLANVTAVGGGHGLLGSAGPGGDLTVRALNTIASGGDEDVFAEGVALGRITFDLSHSSFATVGSSGTEVSVTPNTEAGNQAAPPVFVDAAAGDYREAFGSPTYRAGDLAAVEAEREARNSLYDYDLDGLERTTTCEGKTFVDIGAYQLGCPEPEEPGHEDPRGTTSQPTAPVPTTGAPPATTTPAPRLARLTLKPAKFRVAAATKAARKAGGTRIAFTLTAPAKVRLQVLGRKAAKDKKKRKVVVLGSLPSVRGKAGTNRVRFDGRLKGKALKPGRYRLRAIARGAGGASAPVTKAFRILPAP
jgi:hypothetical protein